MFSDYALSIHAREDRPERITEILVNVGLGQPILRVPHEDKKDCFYYLTSTGVLVIASPVKKVIVTMFLPAMGQVRYLYTRAGRTHINPSITKTIKNNYKNFPWIYEIKG